MPFVIYIYIYKETQMRIVLHRISGVLNDRLVRETRVTVILVFYLCTIGIYIYSKNNVNGTELSCWRSGSV